MTEQVPGPALRGLIAIDRGPPVGYAVVDATGSIRYRTLAPEISELQEVSVVLGAL